MAKRWRHAELGEFRFDEDEAGWCKIIDLPAFDVFTDGYEAEAGEKYELVFSVDDSAPEPSTDAVELAKTVIANQSILAGAVTKALWDSFTGQGPKTSIWWHGDLDQVHEAMKWYHGPQLKEPDDLRKCMCFSRIHIEDYSALRGERFAELCFGALYEQEHGVGLLTDGHRIRGLGYSYDATPYELESG